MPRSNLSLSELTRLRKRDNEARKRRLERETCEQRAARRRRSSERSAARFKSLSRDKKDDLVRRVKARRSAESDAERIRRKTKRNARLKGVDWDSLSPGEKQERLDHTAALEIERARRAALTPQQRKAENRAFMVAKRKAKRDRRAALSDEEREAEDRTMKLAEIERRNRLTDEERKAEDDKKEQKKAARRKANVDPAKWKARNVLTDEARRSRNCAARAKYKAEKLRRASLTDKQRDAEDRAKKLAELERREKLTDEERKTEDEEIERKTKKRALRHHDRYEAQRADGTHISLHYTEEQRVAMRARKRKKYHDDKTNKPKRVRTSYEEENLKQRQALMGSHPHVLEKARLRGRGYVRPRVHNSSQQFLNQVIDMDVELVEPEEDPYAFD